MAWNEALVTNAGLELLSRSVSGEGLEIVSAAGGELTQRDPENMTNIPLPRHGMEITGISRIEYGVSVGVRLHNIGVKKAYRLRQIGLFARISGSPADPVLLAVIQDGEGEEIPARSDNPEYLLEFNFLIPVSSTADITAVLKPGIFATLDDIRNHTHPAMTGAAEHLDGASGFVPKPSAGEQEKFLRADGSWQYVPKTHPFAERVRDCGKPDYGYSGAGEWRLWLNADDYTGTAEIAIVQKDESLLDADNMTQNADKAEHGEFIVKGV